ncbi:hypothetical protein L7F22_026951 [Adiantum nelumboides]|nr:hypothetical protein [Adiantum nelumboides]
MLSHRIKYRECGQDWAKGEEWGPRQEETSRSPCNLQGQSVPLGTSFTTAHTFWMQSQNERFQLDLRSWLMQASNSAWLGHCALTLRNDGVLALTLTIAASSSPVAAWQTPTAGLQVQNLTLQDDGNLVLVDGSSVIVWQSFGYFHHFFLIRSSMRFVQNITLYDRVPLYSDFSTPGSYALRMGSQG